MEITCVVILYRQNVSAYFHSGEVRKMKKRLLSIIAVLLIIFTQSVIFAAPAGATSGSESVKIELTVDKQSVRKGQTFYITYNLSNASQYDISYLSFSIYYNSADFEYCQFVANDEKHYHSGSNVVVNTNTNKINLEFEANPDYAYFHNQSRTASIALKMKYKGNGYMEDTVQEFYIGDTVVKSEANYTYTAVDHTFTANEIKTQSASIKLTALSSDNTLSSIDLKAGGNKIALEPTFSPQNTQYTAYVEFAQGAISANFPVNHDGAKVSHNFSQQINTGSNDYYIVVTAENGSIRTYNINLHLVPQGMTLAEYKDYLASLNAPVPSEPEVIEPEPEQSQTDTTPSEVQPEAPIVEDVVSPTEPVESVVESTVKKNSGGFKGFLENLSPAVLIGIVGGLIILVAGGFTAGYIAHKKVQREKMLASYLDYYNDDYYDDTYTDYGYEDEYYDTEEYYDEY